ncbi:MAG: hypothetical protein JXQ96_20800 [Cyclobacteriaceae bacterium]
MSPQKLSISFFLLAYLSLGSHMSQGQQVENVPAAFGNLGNEPEAIIISNELNVPTSAGHLQGIQLIEKDEQEKLLLSGSSRKQSYILQVDLASGKTDKLIPLMDDPFRHAGGIQVSDQYLIVGIEDNIIKTTSKVCLYDYRSSELYDSRPNVTIERQGEVKRYTSGATGLLPIGDKHLALVSNWDSRNWDFYEVDLNKSESKLIQTFEAPVDWGSYQSINLLKDKEAIYAIGTYQKGSEGIADLILVSNLPGFGLIMKIIDSKTFNCKNDVDFATAAGIQIDSEGKLHIWASQRDALKQISINKFSEE